MNYKRITLLVLRVVLGWLLLYAGWQKLTATPAFSAAGYLNSAVTFHGLYHWFASPGILPVVNILNVWGQILLGLALISGFWIRWTAKLAALMMILYYFPSLKFPHITNDPHAFIVDEHIIYAAGYLVLDAMHAGRVWGLDRIMNKNQA